MLLNKRCAEQNGEKSVLGCPLGFSFRWISPGYGAFHAKGVAPKSFSRRLQPYVCYASVCRRLSLSIAQPLNNRPRALSLWASALYKQRFTRCVRGACVQSAALHLEREKTGRRPALPILFDCDTMALFDTRDGRKNRDRQNVLARCPAVASLQASAPVAPVAPSPDGCRAN